MVMFDDNLLMNLKCFFIIGSVALLSRDVGRLGIEKALTSCKIRNLE